MKKLYEFNWDYGRSGEVSGVFIADDEDVKKVIGEEVYFGEILGKHSEVYGILEEKHLVVKSEEQDFITKLRDVFGDDTISGYNPIETYLEYE